MSRASPNFRSSGIPRQGRRPAKLLSRFCGHPDTVRGGGGNLVVITNSSSQNHHQNHTITIAKTRRLNLYFTSSCNNYSIRIWQEYMPFCQQTKAERPIRQAGTCAFAQRDCSNAVLR